MQNVIRNMCYRTSDIGVDEVDHLGRSRIEFSDMEVCVEKYLANVDAPEVVVEVIVQFQKLTDLELVFCIECVEFFVY